MSAQRSKHNQDADWFPWSDAFATGIAQIDREHRLIFKQLNRLVAAGMELPDGWHGDSEPLCRMVRTAHRHLESEGVLWQSALGLHPWVKRHLRQHAALRDRLTADLRKARDSREAGVEVLLDLVRWLANHILREDLRMARAVHWVGEGLAPAAACRKAAAEQTADRAAMESSVLALFGSAATHALAASAAQRDRMRAEQSALEQEFQALFENSGAGIATHELIFDADGRPVDYVFLRANAAFADHTGLPLEKVTGRRATELLPGLSETGFLEMFGRVVHSGKPERFTNYSAPLGRHYAGNAFKLQGNQFAVIFEDVTATVEAEQQAHLLKRAFDLGASAIVIVDAMAGDYPIVYTNAAFTRLTGYSAAECKGKNCRFLQQKDRDQPDLEIIRRALREETSAVATLRNYRKDGTLFWNRLAIAPLHDKDNKLTHYVGIQTDLTEIKALEIRANEERDLATKREAVLKQAQILAKAGHWEYEAATDKLTWSDEVYRIFGLDPEQFPATYAGFLATVHPEDLEAVKVAYDEHLRTRKPYFIQHRIRLPDGGIKHVQERCETTFDEAGRPLRSLGVVLDVTEFKHSQAALQESEARNRAIFAAIEDMIFIIDRDGVFLDCPAEAEDRLYVPKSEFLGRHIAEVLPEDVANSLTEAIKECLRQGRSQKVEYSLPISGKECWFEANITPMDEKRVLSVVHDITSRKTMENELRNQQQVLEERVAQRTALLREQEQLYRGLVESQQDLIVRVDRDNCFTFVNDAYCRYFGKTRAELLGSSFAPMVHEDDIGPTLEAMKHLEQPPHRTRIEQRALSKDGWRWIAWEDCAVLDADGNIREIQGVGRDITEMKAAQEAAESASRAKTQFLAKMSHEIRTPLNAIIGFARILEREVPQGGRAAGHVRTIVQSSEHLIAMANDLLDVGRIESGNFIILAERFDLSLLLHEMAEVFRLRAAEKGLRFLYEPAANLPGAVTADQTKLRQIIFNLLDNAIKFTDAGRVVLRAGLEIAVDGGSRTRMASIVVEDTGCGIPAEDLPRLFDDFFQGNTGKAFGGTGLGLPICRKLLALMGGRIEVDSTPGAGTRLHCQIPVTPARDGPDQPPRPARRAIPDVSQPDPPPRKPPTRAEVATLPETLRGAMSQAVANGNMAAMRRHIEQVRASHPAVAEGLRLLADRYDYAALENILCVNQVKED